MQFLLKYKLKFHSNIIEIELIFEKVRKDTFILKIQNPMNT